MRIVKGKWEEVSQVEMVKIDCHGVAIPDVYTICTMVTLMKYKMENYTNYHTIERGGNGKMATNRTGASYIYYSYFQNL